MRCTYTSDSVGLASPKLQMKFEGFKCKQLFFINHDVSLFHLGACHVVSYVMQHTRTDVLSHLPRGREWSTPKHPGFAAWAGWWGPHRARRGFYLRHMTACGTWWWLWRRRRRRGGVEERAGARGEREIPIATWVLLTPEPDNRRCLKFGRFPLIRTTPQNKS